MATTPKVSENPSVQQHYMSQIALSAALSVALRRLFVSTEPLSGERGLRSFRAGLQAVVELFSQAAASQSRDYYLNVRREAGVSGVPRILQVAPPPASLVDAGLDYAMRVQRDAAAAEARILSRVDASMQKAVMDVSREQVVAAVQGDDEALGFRRVARPGACAWCLTQAMRRSVRGDGGDQHFGVYKTRESAGQLPPNTLGQINRYHNNCHCGVEPVFTIGDAAAPAWLLDMDRLYAKSTAHSRKGERLNDFRRALTAIRRGEEPAFPAGRGMAPTVSVDARLAALSDLLADLAA